MSLIAFARRAAIPFWSLSSSWQLKACAFSYNWHYRGLICITFAEVAAVPFWSTTSQPFLTSRFSSWNRVNTYAPVFLYSGLTFKLFGWLYDPGWLARAHLYPRSFYPFQKTLLPIRLIVSWPVRESARLWSSFTTHVIQGCPPRPDWIHKCVVKGCIEVCTPCTPGGPMSHLCGSAPPI